MSIILLHNHLLSFCMYCMYSRLSLSNLICYLFQILMKYKSICCCRVRIPRGSMGVNVSLINTIEYYNSQCWTVILPALEIKLWNIIHFSCLLDWFILRCSEIQWDTIIPAGWVSCVLCRVNRDKTPFETQTQPVWSAAQELLLQTSNINTFVSDSILTTSFKSVPQVGDRNAILYAWSADNVLNFILSDSQYKRELQWSECVSTCLGEILHMWKSLWLQRRLSEVW